MNTDNKDHDILVTLVETVKNNQNTLLDKINDVKTEVTDIKTGTTVQLADHEKRIRNLEDIGKQYPADVLVPEFKKLQNEFHDQQLGAKERIKLTAAVASGITFILTVVGAIIGIATGLIQLGG